MDLYACFVTLGTLLAVMKNVYSQSQGCQTAGGDDGQCINVRDCPSQLRLLRLVQSNEAPPGSLDLLRKSICKFENNIPFVCCPVIPKSSLTPTSSPNTCGGGLPGRCGIRGLVDRVISGEDAPFLAWPWMALLQSVGPNGRSSFVCGGVLISECFVLTAAHCVDPKTGFRLQRVRIGEHTLSQNPDCQGGICAPLFQDIDAVETIIHEQYKSPFGCSSCNDIALIRLARPVQFNSLYVQPICLPQNIPQDLGFQPSEFTTNNLRAWVAGWGTTDPVRVQPANVLQQVQLPINNKTLCEVDLRVFPDRNMVLCAGGEQQQDTCRGDSGGPMVMGNVGETRYYVVGIVSKGPRVCGAANTGGLYTNINYYIPWILQKLR